MADASSLDNAPTRDGAGFGLPTRETAFRSFDGRVAEIALHQRPDRYRHLDAAALAGPRIARGNGLSYAAASFGKGVIVREMTAFSRLLDYDEAQRRIRVEAGTTVGDLLAWAVPRGLYLPVVPGHPGVTIGGCIAADVHGKNPSLDGTFADFVEAITLHCPVDGAVALRDRGSDLFGATCGGYGLTGTIVDATLRLATLPAPVVRVACKRVHSFEEAADRLVCSTAPFSYSWHAGAADGSNLGAGLVFAGEWEPAEGGDTPNARPEAAGTRAPWRLPLRLWNAWTIAAAAKAFPLVSRPGGEGRLLPAYDACFPMMRHRLYHAMFGRTGFGEMQMLVPAAGATAFFRGFRALAARHRPAITFASLKAFRGRSSALGMAGTGLLFAVDYVASPGIGSFEDAMDALVLGTGAQPNVGKDSRLSAAVARRALPGFDRFAETLHRLDPQRLHQSELSRRLGL